MLKILIIGQRSQSRSKLLVPMEKCCHKEYICEIYMKSQRVKNL